MATKLLLLALGGAAGTLSRVGLSVLVTRCTTSAFPVGTLAVNLLGCLLFGLVWAAVDRRGNLSPALQLALLAGFMGAFTTFSTYAFESADLFRVYGLLRAGINVALQNVLGIACVIAGLALGRLAIPAG